jgi:Mg-chelatase subunit ChlI
LSDPGPTKVAIIGPQKKNAPNFAARGVLKSKPDNVLLSREIHPTIIGAEAFHGPVRDGKEWYHLAMVVRLRRSTFRSPTSGEQSKDPVLEEASKRRRKLRRWIVFAVLSASENEAARL